LLKPENCYLFGVLIIPYDAGNDPDAANTPLV